MTEDEHQYLGYTIRKAEGTYVSVTGKELFMHRAVDILLPLDFLTPLELVGG